MKAPKDSPGYVPEKIPILLLLTAQIFFSFLLRWIMRWINLRLNRNKPEVLEAAIARHGCTHEDVKREKQKHAFLDMTDKQ
jgi:MFS transporter, ACS family, allantoate permease